MCRRGSVNDRESCETRESNDSEYKYIRFVIYHEMKNEGRMVMRKAGILLPIFSLPGKYGIGCFSEMTYKFIDFLKEAGQKYWQILPLGPTGYGDSPYQTFCSFAGNPYFISLEQLIKEKLLTKKEVEEVYGKGNASENEKVDYEFLYNTRFALLKKAYEKAEKTGKLEDKVYKKFVKENEYWINDYGLFMEELYIELISKSS